MELDPVSDSLLLGAEFFTKMALPILVYDDHHVGTCQGKNACPNMRRATALCLCKCVENTAVDAGKNHVCLVHWAIEAYTLGSTNNNPQTLVSEDAGRQLHGRLGPLRSVPSRFDDNFVVTRRNSADLKSCERTI